MITWGSLSKSHQSERKLLRCREHGWRAERVIEPGGQIAVGKQVHAQHGSQVRQRPLRLGKMVQPFEQQNGDQGCPNRNAQGVLAGTHKSLYLEVLLKGFEQLNHILPINSALLKLRSTTTSSLAYTQPTSSQNVRLSRRGLLCRAPGRWQAVSGAGLDDSPRGRACQGCLYCAPADAGAARVTPRHRDRPLLACAQCARGGLGCSLE
jgi:hypothetical protein